MSRLLLWFFVVAIFMAALILFVAPSMAPLSTGQFPLLSSFAMAASMAAWMATSNTRKSAASLSLIRIYMYIG